MKNISNIYKYLSEYAKAEYSKKDIDWAISKLSEEEKLILTKRYGEDLTNPKEDQELSGKETIEFFLVVNHLRTLLKEKESRRQTTKLKKEKQKESKNEAENSIATVTSPVDIGESQIPAITKEEYINILEIFNSKEFIQLIKEKSLKENMILSLKLGYIDGKYFSTEAIASFLDMEKQDVVDICKNSLIEFKDRLNEMIDSEITLEKKQGAQYKLEKK